MVFRTALFFFLLSLVIDSSDNFLFISMINDLLFGFVSVGTSILHVLSMFVFFIIVRSSIKNFNTDSFYDEWIQWAYYVQAHSEAKQLHFMFVRKMKRSIKRNLRMANHYRKLAARYSFNADEIMAQLIELYFLMVHHSIIKGLIDQNKALLSKVRHSIRENSCNRS